MRRPRSYSVRLAHFGQTRFTARMEFPLQWACWRLSARLHSEMRLLCHPGSQLAGALGRALRETHCTGAVAANGEPQCAADNPACGAWPPCVYGELIRSQTQTAAGKRRDVPRPLIVCPLDGARQFYRAGELFVFDVTLIGDGIGCFGAARAALERCGSVGVGDDYRQGRGRFVIESVRALHGARPAPFAMPDETAGAVKWNDVAQRAAGLRGHALRVELVRPLRLLAVSSGSNNPLPLLPETFDFMAFWLALSRRLKDLAWFHGQNRLELPFVEDGAVRVTGHDLGWWKAKRYSGTQGREIDASGLLGSFDIEGEFEPLLPYLVAGEWLHVGKNTDLGDGRFHLAPL